LQFFKFLEQNSDFALNKYFDVQNSLVRCTQGDYCTVVLNIGMALHAEMQIVTLGDTDTVQSGMVAAVVIEALRKLAW